MKRLIVAAVILAVIVVMALRGCPRVRRSARIADEERLHNCESSCIEDAAVTEKFGDKTVREGIIQVFQIDGNEKAMICYA